VVPAFELSATSSLPANPRDWYEYESASDRKLLFFIEAVERDILSVASLYIRLSNFAACSETHRDESFHSQENAFA
jgi:hypothetical protein